MPLGFAKSILTTAAASASASTIDFVTVNGGSSPTLDTSNKKIGTGSFNFNGSNQGLELDYDRVRLAGTDPWTCEFWVQPTSGPNYAHMAGHWTGPTADRSWSFGRRSGGQYFFNHTNGSGSAQSTQAGSIPQNQFTYLSATYTGSVVYIHVGGSLGSTITISGGFNAPASGVNFTVGVMDNYGDDFVGQIDAFRLSKIARYGSGSYTPPTSALTSDSDTLNLTHFDSDLTNDATFTGNYGV